MRFLRVVEDAKVLQFPSHDKRDHLTNYQQELSRILATPVGGNFHFDQGLWERANKFILSGAPRSFKMKVLAKIDEIIGETSGLTEKDLDDYIDFLMDAD